MDRPDRATAGPGGEDMQGGDTGGEGRGGIRARVRAALLPLLAAIVTLVCQEWVGRATVYAPELEPGRLKIHRAIVENRPPPGETWHSMGANGINVRVASVFLVEGLHRATGRPVLKLYKHLDTVCLFTALILLALFLRRWFDPLWCLVGTLYFAAVLPLTYFFALFHPWDRLDLVAWLVLLFALRARRPWLFAALLVVSTPIKYSTVALPGLWWLVHVRREDWLRTSLATAAFLALAFGTSTALRMARPGGFDAYEGGLAAYVVDMLASNAGKVATFNIALPPLLALALPLLTGAFGLSGADRFVRMAALFALLLFVPFALLVHIEEFRMQVQNLVLLLPLSLLGLRSLLVDGRGN